MPESKTNTKSIKRSFTDYAIGLASGSALVFSGIKNNAPIEPDEYFPLIYLCLLGGYGSYKVTSHGLAYLRDQKKKDHKFTIL